MGGGSKLPFFADVLYGQPLRPLTKSVTALNWEFWYYVSIFLTDESLVQVRIQRLR